MDIHTLLQLIGDILVAIGTTVGGFHVIKTNIKSKGKKKLTRKEKKLLIKEHEAKI